MKKYGAFSSSQNPDEIAQKVKGVVLALSSVIIYVAFNFFGIEIGANDMVSLATALGTLSGAVWAIYGVILHLIAFFAEKKPQ